MRVRELIEKLTRMDQDAMVIGDGYEYDQDEVTAVQAVKVKAAKSAHYSGDFTIDLDGYYAEGPVIDAVYIGNGRTLECHE